MRWLILSDIHGNYDALEAAMEDAQGLYDDIVCLGDLVDYGAEPNEVVRWVRDHVKHVIRGNHDRVCAGLGGLEDFSPIAQAAAIWTHGVMTPETLDYVIGLPKGPATLDGFTYCHGAMTDEDDYLITLDDARNQRDRLATPVTFFGHTHVQGGFLLNHKGARRVEATAFYANERNVEIKSDEWYLLNPGAVGQPRDGDPRAAYAIYSPGDRLFTHYRVTYDVESAMAKIVAAGLPDRLAERLATGA